VLFHFKGEEISAITNKILFNIYDNQTNYHNIKGNGEWNEFITHPDQDSYFIPKTFTWSILFLTFLSVLSIFLFGYMGYQHKRTKQLSH